MDLIKEELEQIRYQIDLLEAIFDEHDTKKECCSLKKSFNYYYDYFLYKFGLCDCKEK